MQSNPIILDFNHLDCYCSSKFLALDNSSTTSLEKLKFNCQSVTLNLDEDNLLGYDKLIDSLCTQVLVKLLALEKSINQVISQIKMEILDSLPEEEELSSTKSTRLNSKTRVKPCEESESNRNSVSSNATVTEGPIPEKLICQTLEVESITVIVIQSNKHFFNRNREFLNSVLGENKNKNSGSSGNEKSLYPPSNLDSSLFGLSGLDSSTTNPNTPTTPLSTSNYQTFKIYEKYNSKLQKQHTATKLKDLKMQLNTEVLSGDTLTTSAHAGSKPLVRTKNKIHKDKYLSIHAIVTPEVIQIQDLECYKIDPNSYFSRYKSLVFEEEINFSYFLVNSPFIVGNGNSIEIGSGEAARKMSRNQHLNNFNAQNNFKKLRRG